MAGRGSRTVRQVLGDKLALLAAFTFSTMYYLPGSGTASQGDHSSVPGIPADPVTGTPRRASGSGLSKRR
ncbi:MAG TPA: hypothetical protein VFJ07_16865 [Streptosporangiaceae bacterium]|nr:hypothetical protein [Streptosporangiaceae bacterium]